MRWLILIASFALWLSCIGALYVNYRPVQEKDVAPAGQAALDRLFAENAEEKSSWRIFVNMAAFKNGMTVPPDSASAKSWDGRDESALTEVGVLGTEVNRKHETRLSQTSELHINVPDEVDVPLLKILGNINYKSWADISQDNGLENFSSSLSVGMGLEVQALGVREGDALNVTQNVMQKDKRLLTQRVNIPVGRKSAPNSDLMPFQSNREIRDGLEWEITMLDTRLELRGDVHPKLLAIKAKCTGRRQIMLNGSEVTVFQVVTADGSARAWYSADGVVLKQAYKLAGLVEIIAVRDDTGKFHRSKERFRHK